MRHLARVEQGIGNRAVSSESLQTQLLPQYHTEMSCQDLSYNLEYLEAIACYQTLLGVSSTNTSCN